MRSGSGTASVAGSVVRTRRRGVTATMPFSAMRRSVRLWLTQKPRRRSSPVMGSCRSRRTRRWTPLPPCRPPRRGTTRPSWRRSSGSGSPVRLLHPEGRCFSQQIAFCAQLTVLAPEPCQLLALLGRQAFTLSPVDPLLAHPVADGLLDQIELSRHVGDASSLVDHERRDVTPELAGVPPSPATSRLLLGH